VNRPQQHTGAQVRLALRLRGKEIRAWTFPADQEILVGSAERCDLRIRGKLQPEHVRLFVEDGQLGFVACPGAIVELDDEPADVGFLEDDEELELGGVTLACSLDLQPAAQPEPEPEPEPAPEPEPEPELSEDPDTEETAKPLPVFLRIETPSGKVHKLPLRPRTFFAGSGDVPLKLPAKGIRPRHALFTVNQAHRVRVRPVDGAPLKLNGHHIGECELAAGDTLHIGHIAFQLADASNRPLEGTPQQIAPIEPDTEPEDEPTSPTVDPNEFTSDLAPELPPEFFEEEDEDQIADLFNLSEQLQARTPDPKAAKQGTAVGQVRLVHNGSLLWTQDIAAMGSWASGDRAIQIQMQRDGMAVTVGPNIAMPGAGGQPVVIPAGQSASADQAGYVYQLAAYYPEKRRFELPRPNLMLVAGLLLALGGHALMGLGFDSLSIGSMEMAADEEEEEVFATVEMKKPEAPPPPPTATNIAERAPDVSSQQVANIPTSRKPSRSVDDVLAKLSAPSAGSGAAEAITNIQSVETSSAGSSGFNLTGRLAALPDGKVSVARSGAGASDLAGLGNDPNAAVAGRLQKSSSGSVRGKVTTLTSQVRVQGSLSREQVSAVIRKHTRRVQACYEKQLVKNPGLAGRIVFEWTVRTNGSTEGVRVRSSSMQNTQVADCIGDLIKGWTFPEPDGGAVTITYPFLFRASQ